MKDTNFSMSGDPESRIAARRVRIAASLRASRESQDKVGVSDEGKKERATDLFARTQEVSATLLKTQLKEKIILLRSLANERALTSSWNKIYKAAEDSQEDTDATETADIEQERLGHNQLLDACIVPQDLYSLICELLKDNESTLLGKHQKIDTMKMKLSQKDEEYSTTINLHKKYMQNLLILMSYQAVKLREFHKQELQNVENMFLDQRKILLSANKQKLEELLVSRIDLESTYQEELHSCKDKFSKLLDTIRDNDVEEFNALKIRLEGDAESLAEHLQVMQAMYQLNAEKLEYNLLVLTEREHENYTMTNQQKKKLTRQRDTLSIIKGRHRELEKYYIGQNEKLAEEYNRVTKLLQDLQRKERSLQSSHAMIKKKFFYMHQQMISAIVSRLLQADKKIHEEELEWIWKSPSNTVLHRLGSQLSMQDGSKPDNSRSTTSMDLNQFQTFLQALKKERYQSFLEILNKEASFLIDLEYLKELRSVDEKVQFQVWSAAILCALGVGNASALEKLFIFFTNRMGKCNYLGASILVLLSWSSILALFFWCTLPGAFIMAHPFWCTFPDVSLLAPSSWCLYPDDGMNILKLKSLIQGESFSDTFSAGEDDDTKTLAISNNCNKTRGSSFSIHDSSARNAEKLNWNGYWRSFTTVISPKVLRVYQHLISALLIYNQMLKDRLSASKDVLLVKQHNQRLQLTMDYCLSSRQ
ncbi:hypothetical protein R1sor_004169 [Riccia sorocarpa]|uniref:Dynein regulatory complex protein 1 C-terminal domain-containing protein n=1 Tax=Riccia sorocarpa TaxID=122646 RepID=A0ABD3H3R2_9MARC